MSYTNDIFVDNCIMRLVQLAAAIRQNNDALARQEFDAHVFWLVRNVFTSRRANWRCARMHTNYLIALVENMKGMEGIGDNLKRGGR